MKQFTEIYRTLTPLGWAMFFTLILVPFLLGWAWGYTTQDHLIKLQSRTNGMEHTNNYKQLHKAEEVHYHGGN